MRLLLFYGVWKQIFQKISVPAHRWTLNQSTGQYLPAKTRGSRKVLESAGGDFRSALKKGNLKPWFRKTP
jgi:hypothetical protein